MRNAWLKTIAVAFAASGMTGSSVFANPAGMALPSARPVTPTTSAVTAAATTAPQVEPFRPSSQISPTKNPLKYFAAAMSELPFAANVRGASANPVMQPAAPQLDNAALSKSAGPPTPELSISMAQTSERQGDIQAARQHFGQALSMWPGHVEVLRAAARMEDRLGELAMAETLYQQAVTANPQHAGALNDLGLCLARQGRLEASVQVIEQAVQLQPEKALYRNNAATVLVEMRQDQRALGHLAAVHGAAEANYNLGQLFVQRGRPQEATPYFQAAVQQNPQMQSAQLALAKLQGATTPDTTTPAQPTVPLNSPATPPQAPTAGPQFHYYPATARSPELGASTYVPPVYYGPQRYTPPAGAPANGQTPTRYLPPVASQPGPVQR